MANYQAADTEVGRSGAATDQPSFDNQRDFVCYSHRLPVETDAARLPPLEDGLQYFLELEKRRNVGADT